MEIQEKRDGNRGEFFSEADGERIGEMCYTTTDDIMIIEHTEVFDRQRGKGLAKELVRSGVEYARQHNMKIVAGCSYARHVISTTPEYQDILSSS